MVVRVGVVVRVVLMNVHGQHFAGHSMRAFFRSAQMEVLRDQTVERFFYGTLGNSLPLTEFNECIQDHVSGTAAHTVKS